MPEHHARKADDAAEALSRLIALMAQLRDPQHGCPWDREQNFASIAPYTIEEAYEVRAAIERGEPRELRDELGDLLFQVVFHARLAEERAWFDFAAVARSIHDKLVRRHPHVFGAGEDGDRADVEGAVRWEDLKARERAERAREAATEASALSDVPLALPALMRAAKLSRRAARVGFDWQEARQVRQKVMEEIGEIDAAEAGGEGRARVAEEVGDLLFALVNWSRHLGVDPEEALRAANGKFERRFRRMETLARERGMAAEHYDAARWDELWRAAKGQE